VLAVSPPHKEIRIQLIKQKNLNFEAGKGNNHGANAQEIYSTHRVGMCRDGFWWTGF
jgi:hypothetical protein